MPSRFWVPLHVTAMPEQHHIHAAFSGWFDRDGDEPAVVSHDSVMKPYTLSPPSVQEHSVGVEVSTLTDEAETRLWTMASTTSSIRLGMERIRIGRPQRTLGTTWEGLRSAMPAREWTVEFLTPTSFRSGKNPHLLPTAGLILRSAQLAWNRYSPGPPIPLDRSVLDAVMPVDLELTTSAIKLGARTQRGCLGWVTYRCSDQGVAARVAPLFGLLPYSGVGSHRIKGLGQVMVSASEPTAVARQVATQ